MKIYSNCIGINYGNASWSLSTYINSQITLTTGADGPPGGAVAGRATPVVPQEGEAVGASQNTAGIVTGPERENSIR